MKKKDKIEFILNKTKDNYNHIGFLNKLTISECEDGNVYITNLISVNIYSDGKMTYIIDGDVVSFNKEDGIYLRDRSIGFINAIYKEVLNNRYL